MRWFIALRKMRKRIAGLYKDQAEAQIWTEEHQEENTRKTRQRDSAAFDLTDTSTRSFTAVSI